MEPDIMPMYSSSPPPLDYDGEAEEDEFGDFGGFSVISCSAHTDFNEHSPSPRQASPTTEPGTPPPSFKQPVEQSQPASTVKSGCSSGQGDEEGQHCNGYTVRDHPSETHEASLAGEETGFADFSVFTEQAAHPWCCGFAPVGTEGWDGREGDINLADSLGKQPCDSGQEAVMNSEPRSHCTSKAQEDICTKVKHCEKRDAALVQPSQGQHPPQEPAAAQDFPSEETQPGEEELEEPEESRKETRCSPNFYSSQTSESEEERKSVGGGEDRENSISPPSHTASVYESAAEDLTLFCDALTPDSLSVDCELNVPCLDFEADEPDWGHQADEEEEEELENSKPADSIVNQGVGDLSQSQSETPATQETSTTSNQSESETYAGDGFADFKHGGFDHENEPSTDDAEEPWPSLPPSDSFADFCSASTHEDGDGSWVEFRGPRTQVEEDRPWTEFTAQDSSQQTEADTGEECGSSEGSRCQASLCGRVQKLLHVTFPGALVPAAGCEEEEEEKEKEEEVFDLAALLQAQDRPSCEKEEMEETCLGAQGVQWGMCWQLQDVHSAVGLKFQWGGSHTNRTLLRCLGVDTKNIVFIGMKKKPMVVPAFASSLGMLEPSKDTCSPGHTAVTAQTPASPPDRLDPSTDSVKEPLPPRQLDCSSSGLSSSQDGVTSQASLLMPQQSTAASPLALNLDYFGPVEEKESSSSSSRSNSPPPGVDRELYELTISKLETSVGSNHGEDTLNRLMSTAETTSTSVRAHQQVEELSAEATMVISVLPDLSFMMAKVLMFPSILTSKEFCIPTSE
ncbi:uncharacterized protein LOC143008570 isoform X2 [Genypterus blacodes]|uniref:uncharacterized protein LOC143008570 isoform X2 n=1 Tax=Genypterus blacodes TaxID=154954 RepID=UPI003F771516